MISKVSFGRCINNVSFGAGAYFRIFSFKDKNLPQCDLKNFADLCELRGFRYSIISKDNYDVLELTCKDTTDGPKVRAMVRSHDAPHVEAMFSEGTDKYAGAMYNYLDAQDRAYFELAGRPDEIINPEYNERKQRLHIDV